jgi:malate/lactate dehydrogenase
MIIEFDFSLFTSECVITTSPMEAFADTDIAILIASMPHLPGMERIDLLRANTKIFRETGEALEKVAKRSIKVLVVANPSNTNALVTMKYAPSIDPSQFTGLSMLDHNRTVAQVSQSV